jgi:hypothetical protein
MTRVPLFPCLGALAAGMLLAATAAAQNKPATPAAPAATTNAFTPARLGARRELI